METRPGARAAALAAVLREAGLESQVRVGVSLPLPVARAPRRSGPHAPGGKEEALDALLLPLPGGLPRGQLIEIEGGPSSGRTALAYRMVAGATARGELVAWVDLPDALDPRSLRRAGADLGSLLWVRPPRLQAALRAAELLLRAGFAVVVLDLEGARHDLARGSPAVWSRLQRAVREGRAAAVLLGACRASGAFATLGVYTERSQSLFEQGLFEGLESTVTVLRNRGSPVGAEYPLRVSHRPVPR